VSKMADDGKVIIDTSLDDSGAVKGMKKLGSTLARAGGAAIKGTIVGLGAVATGIGAIGVSAVKYNADMEQYLTSFEVMTGSAEKAASVMTEIKDIAAKTPFETTDIVKATQNLMAFGFSADEALASFQTLGDLSQGNAQKLESYTLALGKMQSSQKVTLESLNLMIDFCHAA
jgi:TP901 family phage tail tape measure protein